MNTENITVFNLSGIYEDGALWKEILNGRPFYDVGGKERPCGPAITAADMPSGGTLRSVKSAAASAVRAAVSCRDLRGTNGICDEAAGEELLRRMRAAGGAVDGIHFLDNGNYHYISQLLTKRIRRPYMLVLLDHHPDLQPPAFGALLTCGGWVREALRTQPNLKRVIAVGVDEILAAQALEALHAEQRSDASARTGRPADNPPAGNLRPCAAALRRRIAFYRMTDCRDAAGGYCLPEKTELPLYISLDKDVLSAEEVTTNWGQGSMRVKELFAFLEALLRTHDVIGVDVCGECAPGQEESEYPRAAWRNDALNLALLRLFRQEREKEDKKDRGNV